MSRPLRALIEALACTCCNTAHGACPTCSEPWEIELLGARHRFPCTGPDQPCPTCGTLLRVVVVGWHATEDPLSDRLPDPTDQTRSRLEAAYRRPAARRKTAKPKPNHLTPCPRDAARLRLADWAAHGLELPPDLPPATIAKAYRQTFGTDPARDHQHRQSRAYSWRELFSCLGTIAGVAVPPDPIPDLWAAALQRLALPSTRMLLSQQAQLLEVGPSAFASNEPRELVARVAVSPDWLPLVEARAELLTNALTEAIGLPCAVDLQEVAR